MFWSLPGGLLWVFLWHWLTPTGLASQQLLDNISPISASPGLWPAHPQQLLVVCPWFLGAAARVPEAVPGALRDPAENKEEHFCGEHMPVRAGHALRSQQRLWQRTRMAASAAPASSCARGLPRATISVQRGASAPGALCTGPSIPAASASTASPGGPSGSTEAPYGGARRSVCLSVCLSPADRRSSSPHTMPAARRSSCLVRVEHITDPAVHKASLCLAQSLK